MGQNSCEHPNCRVALPSPPKKYIPWVLTCFDPQPNQHEQQINALAARIPQSPIGPAPISATRRPGAALPAAAAAAAKTSAHSMYSSSRSGQVLGGLHEATYQPTNLRTNQPTNLPTTPLIADSPILVPSDFAEVS